MSKSYQLRVRLDGGLHEQLLARLASEEGQVLSDLVRDALQAYLDPSGSGKASSLTPVSVETRELIQQLSQRLERREEHVLEDCVQGIVDCFEDERVPLIVQELRLRRDFFAKARSS